MIISHFEGGTMNTYSGKRIIIVLTLSFLLMSGMTFSVAKTFTPEDVWKTRTASGAVISPDGTRAAYLVSYQRSPADEPGTHYRNLYVADLKTGEIKPFITGKTRVSSPHWSPDGKEIAFLMKRGEDAKTQVWIIPVDGGEAWQATDFDSSVRSFHWSPDGRAIAFTSVEALSPREKKMKDKGYNFIYFEENLHHVNLYLAKRKKCGMFDTPERITNDITVWDFEFAPDGAEVAVRASEKNLVDYNYMFSKIYIVDVKTGKHKIISKNEGKLGGFSFSPDGKKLVYCAAKMLKDHAVSQVYVINKNGEDLKNLTPENYEGHVSWADWKDNDTIIYYAAEHAWPLLATVKPDGTGREVILDSRKSGVIFGYPDFTADFDNFVFTASTPYSPSNPYSWSPGEKMKLVKDLNPWVKERKLGRQKVIKYKARDGWDIEGVLTYPAYYKEGKRYPLIVSVHGGPEAYRANGWLTRYSMATQVLAGKGYFVFTPNYRASTGFGLKYALAGYQDAAGAEFDDIADGIDYLVKEGLVDRERVGLGGGSYGGYAAAWFSSYYTKYVRAVVMFVGISDLISKRNTTDIPYEELYVHSGKPLEEMWEESLKRSPVYYAHQSKSAVLIVGGTDDPRVHPGQSLEYFRLLKFNKHPAVRMVRYPGEVHGNRKQPARLDLLYRHLRWYDWYVKEKKPLDGPMPSYDLSDKYGLDLD